MALAPKLEVTLSSDAKKAINQLTAALEKVAGGDSLKAQQFTQYITGGDEGFDLPDGTHVYVVRLKNCSNERSAEIIQEMVRVVGLEGPEEIEVEKR